METEAKKRKKGKKTVHYGAMAFNGFMLKIYGCITMVLLTLSAAVFQTGLLHAYQYTAEELDALIAASEELQLYQAVSSCLQALGGLCIPVFAFLLVEGFLHTTDFKRYLLTMLGFAVLSEVPYDLAVNGQWLDLSSQNVLFTLAIGLLMLHFLEKFEGHEEIIYRVDQGLVVLLALFWSWLLNCSYGLCMILLIAVYYLLREHKLAKILIGCGISVVYITAPLSGLALWVYNGERGWDENKYLFYLFYPLHLLVLWYLPTLLG
jgi:hypothetical protein